MFAPHGPRHCVGAGSSSPPQSPHRAGGGAGSFGPWPPPPLLPLSRSPPITDQSTGTVTQRSVLSVSCLNPTLSHHRPPSTSTSTVHRLPSTLHRPLAVRCAGFPSRSVSTPVSGAAPPGVAAGDRLCPVSPSLADRSPAPVAQGCTPARPGRRTTPAPWVTGALHRPPAAPAGQPLSTDDGSSGTRPTRQPRPTPARSRPDPGPTPSSSSARKPFDTGQISTCTRLGRREVLNGDQALVSGTEQRDGSRTQALF